MPRKHANKQEEAKTAGLGTVVTDQSLIHRFVVFGVKATTSLEYIYKHFSKFGEVKFCVKVPHHVQLSQLGEYTPADVKQFGTQVQRPAVDGEFHVLVEVSEHETILRIKDPRAVTYSCAVLAKSTPVCDSLIEDVHARKIFVFGLKKNIDEAMLFQLFSRFGDIEAVRIVRNSNDFRSKGYGFVIYKDSKSRALSLTHKGIPFEEKTIQWIPYRDDSKIGDKQTKLSKFPEEQAISRIETAPSPQMLKERDFQRQSTGLKQYSSSEESQVAYSNVPYKTNLLCGRNWTEVQGEIDHQYKFNRSRIISSAAVRKYFARRLPIGVSTVNAYYSTLV